MSLFRAVRSLVGNLSGKEEVNPSATPKIVLDHETQMQIADLKTMWTIFCNFNEGAERTQHFWKILPVFVGIYKDLDYQSISETFGEQQLKQFIYFLLTYFVRKIQDQKLSRDPAINSVQIVQLVSVPCNKNGVCDYMNVLEVMCGKSNLHNISDVFVESRVPTNVFSVIESIFDLPEEDRLKYSLDIERMFLLFGALCGSKRVIEDLKKANILNRLLEMITSTDRKIIAFQDKILRVVSAIMRTQKEIDSREYLELMKYLISSVEILEQDMKSYSPEYLIRIWDTIVEWIKESLEVSDQVLKHFVTISGYTIFLKTHLFFEESQVSKELLENLVKVVCKFVFIGKTELPMPSSISPEMGPVIEALSAERGKPTAARNLEAFLVLQNYFLASSWPEARGIVVDNIFSIYSTNYVNFLLLQQLHTLAHFMEPFESLTPELKDGVLNVLVFVVTVVNYIPFQELSSLGCLVQPTMKATTMEKVFRTVIQLIKFDTNYKGILSETGLLHMLQTWLTHCHTEFAPVNPETFVAEWNQESEKASQGLSNPQASSPHIITLSIVVDCLIALLDDFPSNISTFRKSGCVPFLYSWLYPRETRPIALRMLQCLIFNDKLQEYDEIESLIEILQASPSLNWQMKFSILRTIQVAFVQNRTTKSTFRGKGGYSCLIALLGGMEAFKPSTKDSDSIGTMKLDVLKIVFQTLIASLKSQRNRTYFRDHIAGSFLETLTRSGLFSDTDGLGVMEGLLQVATESTSEEWKPNELRIIHPTVVATMFQLLNKVSLSVQEIILRRILEVLQVGRGNHDVASFHGFLGFILFHFEAPLSSKDHPLHSLLIGFLQELTGLYMSAKELRMLLGYTQKPDAPPSILRVLRHVIERQPSPPYMEFDLQRNQTSYLHVLSFGDRSWPPANGYSFLCWIYIDSVESPDQYQFDLFQFISDDKRSLTQLRMKNSRLTLQTSSKNSAEFSYTFAIKRWYHVGIVHPRSRFQTSEARLYVDGRLVDTVRAPHSASPMGSVGAFIGSPPNTLATDLCTVRWRLGPCYLIEEPLAWDQVLISYCLGPKYSAKFQGSFEGFESYSLVNSRLLNVVQENDKTLVLGPLNLQHTSMNIPEERIVLALNARNAAFFPTSGRPSLSISQSTNNGGNSNSQQDTPTRGGGLNVILNASLTASARAVIQGSCFPFTFPEIRTTLQTIGGIGVLFQLLDQACTSESLLDGIQILRLFLADGPYLQQDMIRMEGYALLASFLHRKCSLLNRPILEQIFELCGLNSLHSRYSGDSEDNSTLTPGGGDEGEESSNSSTSRLVGEDEEFHQTTTSVISNVSAFQDLILPFQFLWKLAPISVQKLYFHRLNELFVNNPHVKFNVGRFHRLNGLRRLLMILQDETLDESLLALVTNLIRNFFSHQFLREDLQSVHNFLLSTLKANSAAVTGAVTGSLITDRSPLRRSSRRLSSQVAEFAGSLTQLMSPTLSSSNSNLSIDRGDSTSSDGSAGSSTPTTAEKETFIDPERPLTRSEVTRNKILELLFNLVLRPENQSVFSHFITPKWIFLFIEHELHPSTINWGLKILIVLLQVNKSGFASKFLQAGGYSILRDILPMYCHCHSVYYLLVSLMVGKPPADLPINIRLSYSDLFSTFRPFEARTVVGDSLKVLLGILQRTCQGTLHSIPILYENDQVPIAYREQAELKRWKISESDLHIQIEMIRFFKESFIQSAPLQELLWSDQGGDLMRAFLLPLFPFMSLNYPSDQDQEPEGKCHISGRMMFELLSSILMEAAKSSGKLVHTLEQMIEAIPLNISESQVVIFQHRIIFGFIENINKHCPRDTLRESKTIAHNIQKFCSFVTDKIVSGLLPIGGKQFFDFLVELLERIESIHPESSQVDLTTPQTLRPIQIKAKTKYEIQAIWKSLHRVCIHLISLPYGQTQADYLDIIETILYHHQVVLNHAGSGDHGEFIRILVQLLGNYVLQDQDSPQREGAMKVFRLLLLTKNDLMNDILITTPNRAGECKDLRLNGFDLLLKDSDSSSVEFLQWVGENMAFIHSVLAEQTASVWLNYKETESRLKSDRQKAFKAKRQQLLHKREKRQKIIGSCIRDTTNWCRNTILSAQQKVFRQHKKLRQAELDRSKEMDVFWNKWKAHLDRERTRWDAKGLQKYKLDSVEGPNRMRKKLIPNYKFYEHYPYVTGLKPGQNCRIPSSRACIRHFELYGGFTVEAPTKTISSHDLPFQHSLTNLYNDDVTETESEKIESISNTLMETITNAGLNSNPDESLSDSHKNSSDLVNLLDTSSELNPLSGASLPVPVPIDQSSEDSSKLNPDSDLPEPSPSPLSESLESSGVTCESPSENSKDQTTSEDDIPEQESFTEEALPEEDESLFYGMDDDDKLHRILEKGDKIHSIVNCERVDGMVSHPGVFVLCTNNLYLIDYYQLDETSSDKEIIPVQPPPIQHDWMPHPIMTGQPHYRKWRFEDILDVFKRRFLLRPVAMEIFLSDGQNLLVTFATPTICVDIYKRIGVKTSKASTLLDPEVRLIISSTMNTASESVQELGLGLGGLSKIIGGGKGDSLTQKWVQGQISNFQYLMHLNTLAGRSYNDLTQYPVFPWVLADYESEYLDLSNPAVFRDLSKPMGALTEARAMEFQLRFDEWDPEENNNTPKWHYGSHYSSAGTVLYYLIRMEPFAQQIVHFLQSGGFDVPDRLFYSIQESWDSASGKTANMSDVKELIPEFYYLPEFLSNPNEFMLGTRQTGELLDNVVLPPWAHGDPVEFVRLHRMALESDYVSAHLHEWIDLIFGQCQRGRLAEENLNVFYHLTYEGSIDIDLIEDPIEKQGVITQINNFGQTPKQLFTKPHPKRVCSSESSPLQKPSSPVLELLNSMQLERSQIRDLNRQVGHIASLTENRLISLGTNRISVPNGVNIGVGGSSYVSWDFLDFSIRVVALESDRPLQVMERVSDGRTTCCALSVDGEYLVSGGTDSLISVRRLAKSNSQMRYELLKSLSGAMDVIRCLAVSRSYSVIASASENQNSILLWDLNRLKFIRSIELDPPLMTSESVSFLAIAELSGTIVAVAGGTIYVYSINGILLASESTVEITSIFLEETSDWLPFDLITGHSDGTIKIWRLEFKNGSRLLNQELSIKGHACEVTAICMTGDAKRLFTGDKQGKILQWNERILVDY